MFTYDCDLVSQILIFESEAVTTCSVKCGFHAAVENLDRSDLIWFIAFSGLFKSKSFNESVSTVKQFFSFSASHITLSNG